jgi:hypothetical protein
MVFMNRACDLEAIQKKHRRLSDSNLLGTKNSPIHKLVVLACNNPIVALKHVNICRAAQQIGSFEHERTHNGSPPTQMGDTTGGDDLWARRLD